MISFNRKYFTLLTMLCVILAVKSVNTEKEIPITKFSQKVGGAMQMTFLYCYSCGYRKAFDEYYNILHERYPEISIIGSNYDPPGVNMYLSKVILIAKLSLIIILMTSFDFWGSLGQPIPGWWSWCTENKMYACMMIFFFGNMLESQLISSGAFEISLNDVPVWSKLETGRIPNPQELFQIIESQLQFDKFEKFDATNPDFVK
uniref:Putative selenoprotein t n=1 Tax=Corethrella appendiculata TaxID=1370023 RepID=U5EW39_9DIPT